LPAAQPVSVKTIKVIDMLNLQHLPLGNSQDTTSGSDPPTSTLLLLLLQLYGPNLSFKELLRVTKVGRSKAYQLMNVRHKKHDPQYPSGTPLYDTPNSPRIFSTIQAAAWLERRGVKHIID